MFTQMEVETGEPRYFSEENSEYDRIVKLIQSSRADAADLIFEELKKSIKRKGRWIHDDRVWPHENGKLEKGEKNKRKLKIVDNQELYTRFVPASSADEIKSPGKEPKREKPDQVFDLTKEDSDKSENKRLTVSNKNEPKKEEAATSPTAATTAKESNSKKVKTETVKPKDENGSVKSEKSNSSKSGDESNGKLEKYPAKNGDTDNNVDVDIELIMSVNKGAQDEVEPKMLRKRKEVKKENSSLHRISNGGVQKKKSSSGSSAPANLSKNSKGGDALFNLKENMKTHENDASDSAKVRQKMFYGSTQVTRRDKPRREGTLADDSKKRLEAKLKKVKAKLKKSI